MNATTLQRLRDQLSSRDHDILTSLERFRLLSSAHLKRLHFRHHANPTAAARACNRALQRLGSLRLIQPLERRIGGVRRGSAATIWQLASTGEHYLRATQGLAHRRRYVEPGLLFVSHTMAVNDIAVALLEASRNHDGFTVERLDTEPGNWRRYLGPLGDVKWLKPDLYVVTTASDADGDYEAHAFLEIDLGTEHRPRIQAKCQVYASYAATGAYQAQHGLFPAVVWLSPSPARRRALRAAIAATPGLPPELFRVASPADYLWPTASGG